MHTVDKVPKYRLATAGAEGSLPVGESSASRGQRHGPAEDGDRAARSFPVFEDRGTLNVGAPADIAIMEPREGRFDFVDNYSGTRAGRERLFPFATVLAGQVIPRAA